jgi:peroxiredoxin
LLAALTLPCSVALLLFQELSDQLRLDAAAADTIIVIVVEETFTENGSATRLNKHKNNENK